MTNNSKTMTSNNSNPSTDSAAMRLQKFLSRAGVASRRRSEKIISEGHVTVNGEVVTEMGFKVSAADEVAVDGKKVSLLEDDVVIMLHKPSGVITTMDDPKGRPCVADYVPLSTYPSLFPVGRLDGDTTGLLIFTTNGELGNRLMHPRYEVVKTYIACIEGRLSKQNIADLEKGILVDNKMTQPAVVTTVSSNYVKKTIGSLAMPKHCAKTSSRKAREARKEKQSVRSFVRLQITEGRYHQVKRMLGAVGHPVVALHRQTYGSLDLGDLPRGSWRTLSSEEVQSLKQDAEVRPVLRRDK